MRVEPTTSVRARTAYHVLRRTSGQNLDVGIRLAARELLLIWPDEMPPDMESVLPLVVGELLPALRRRDDRGLERVGRQLSAFAERVASAA